MEIASSTRSDQFGILVPYCLGLADPASNRQNLERARASFDSVSAEQTMVLVHTIMETVDDIDLIKLMVTRMLHSFSKALNRVHRPFSRDVPFIEQQVDRNDSIQDTLELLKPMVTHLNRGTLSEAQRQTCRALLMKLQEYTEQYTAKEHILFPIVEHHIVESRCVQLMWAIHDDIRITIRDLKGLWDTPDVSRSELNKLFGKLFFDMKSMVFREEQVLFPVILDRIPKQALMELSQDQHADEQVSTSDERVSDEQVNLITGNPTVRQLIQIFNALPVDLTLVDADDRVVYFNTPGHRIFPRTKAVIGRSVQHCHPPKSMHIVQQILDAFRSKERTEAEFRITVGGRYIRITYTAIYNDAGSYAGTLEVSQDISDLRKLTGEKRLLHWK